MLDTIIKIFDIFLISLIGITLFILPFYAAFRIRKRSTDLGGFNISLEIFFKSREANALIFLWALGEATIWFVIPEFLLVLVLFMRAERKFQLVLYDIYGTIIGTLIAINIHITNNQISQLPFIKPKMVAQVHTWV
jgi:cell shape-determining protein MreD